MSRWPLEVLGLITLAAVSVSAQPKPAEVGGYVKYLISRTDTRTEDPSLDQLIHARLNTAWYPAESLTGNLELRTRAFFGDAVQRTPGFASQLGHDGGIGKLGVALWDRPRSTGYAELDRCYLTWTPGRWQASIGRQRIAWGTNLVWNPTDLFNPYSVLDFDYEERPAVDAIRLQYYTGEVAKIECAVRPGGSATPAIAAAQWTFNEWQYDIHFLAGRVGGRWLAGTGWAGDILGGGFRGELLISERADVPGWNPSSKYTATAALSGDYTFPNSIYVHTEVLFNSEGVTGDAGAPRETTSAIGLLSPARWSLFLEIAGDVTPLLRADLFFIANPNDRSLVAAPSLTWSVVTDLDLTVIALLFNGSAGSEFGPGGSSLFLRARWSF
ncbi:MAG: hypothetical protein AB1428_09900 [Bacteroidota bacterium]